MTPETDNRLNTSLKMPLALALMAGGLAAAPALAQDYYEDEEQFEANYEPEPSGGVHQEGWYDVDEDADDGVVLYEMDEWEFDSDPDLVIYETYYTVEYQPGDEYRPLTGDENTEAEDTDYYYDPYREEPRDRAERPMRRTQRTQSTFQPPAQQSMSASRKVTGELQSYRELGLQGQPEPHTVVKVRTSSGRTALVDLGPRVDLRQMGLQQGDTVVAEGRRGTINNQPVLIATSIRAEGESQRLQTFTADDQLWLQQSDRPQSRQMQQRQQRHDPMMQQGQMTSTAAPTRLQGELQSFGEVQLRGQQDPHTIVELRLQDGQRALVNLGPRVDPQDLDLQRGDRVTVEGRRGKINQQPVLMATSIEVNGQRTRIQQAQATGMQQQDEELREQDESGYLYTTERVAQTGQSGEGRQVSEITSNWPAAAKEAAQAMESKYGEPDAKTSEMLIWNNSGPFVKTIVHKESVQHNFPTPHEDVLEQSVKYDVPADKMDELARFDGSIIVYRTDGLMSARCHKEDMNILALNLADKLIKDELSVEDARNQLAETARAYQQGQQPPMTQELQFNASGNTESPDSPAENTGGDMMESGGSS